MIRVYIQPSLLDVMFTTGYRTPATVVRGVPKGARLLACRMNHEELVELEFYDPEPGPDRTIEVSVQVTQEGG